MEREGLEEGWEGELRLECKMKFKRKEIKKRKKKEKTNQFLLFNSHRVVNDLWEGAF